MEQFCEFLAAFLYFIREAAVKKKLTSSGFCQHTLFNEIYSAS